MTAGLWRSALAAHDQADRRGINPEFTGDNALALAIFQHAAPKLCCLLIGQHRAATAFARRLSPLRGHVPVVLSQGAEEQVVRSAARRIVATVADGKPARNRAYGECVGQAMSQVEDVLAKLHPDQSVPLRVTRSAPLPAVAGPINASPEALIDRPTVGVVPVHKALRLSVPCSLYVLAAPASTDRRRMNYSLRCGTTFGRAIAPVLRRVGRSEFASALQACLRLDRLSCSRYHDELYHEALTSCRA